MHMTRRVDHETLSSLLNILNMPEVLEDDSWKLEHSPTYLCTVPEYKYRAWSRGA